MLTRGRFAAIDSDYEPLSEAARRKLREGVDDNYRVFVQKVADARKRKFEEVEPLAQGRVWLGTQARRNGLVDEMGGLDRAIELVRGKAKIPRRREDCPGGLSAPAQPAGPPSEPVQRKPGRRRGSASLLKRWPVAAFAGSGYLRLMPYSLEVK